MNQQTDIKLAVVENKFNWSILLQKVLAAFLVVVVLLYLPVVASLPSLSDTLAAFLIAVIVSIVNDLQGYFGIKKNILDVPVEIVVSPDDEDKKNGVE